jgi:uncharacterized membrane protein
LAVRCRFAGLDTLRGVALVNMIAYHACWDIVNFFEVDWGWYGSFWAYLWQQSICWTFVLLSGFCWNLGRRKGRRGLAALGGGALVSAVTVTLMPSGRIICGVLTLLGTATLLTIPLDRLLRRVPARLGAACSFLLFLLTRETAQGFLGLQGVRLVTLPRSWYQNDVTACLGFPGPSFQSADYFPLLPWIFLFWTGYYLYRLRRQERREISLPVVTGLGRNSLLVYLLHQPVVCGALWILIFLTEKGWI